MKQTQEARNLELLLLGACLASRKTLDGVDPRHMGMEIGALVEWLKLPDPQRKERGAVMDEWLRKQGCDRNGGTAIEDVIEAVRVNTEYRKVMEAARSAGFRVAGGTKRKMQVIQEIREKLG